MKLCMCTMYPKGILAKFYATTSSSEIDWKCRRRAETKVCSHWIAASVCNHCLRFYSLPLYVCDASQRGRLFTIPLKMMIIGMVFVCRSVETENKKMWISAFVKPLFFFLSSLFLLLSFCLSLVGLLCDKHIDDALGQQPFLQCDRKLVVCAVENRAKMYESITNYDIVASNSYHFDLFFFARNYLITFVNMKNGSSSWTAREHNCG